MSLVAQITTAAVCAAAVFAMSGSVAADTRTFSVKRGEAVFIQRMYWVDPKKCTADKVAPQPQVKRGPKLGALKFYNEPSEPSQCPGTKANSIFVKYVAGNTAGKDRVRITWKPTKDQSFSRTYVITVK